MPKDEFDFEDPFELNGMAMMTHEDTTNDMAECFIEEFMRLGYNHKQVLALFRNSFYVGPNMVLEKRGEPFVHELIAEVFARWGKSVKWDCNCGCRHEEAPTSGAVLPGEPVNEHLLSPALSSTKDVEEREHARQRAGSPAACGDFPLPATQERGEGQGEGLRVDPMGAPIPDITL